MGPIQDRKVAESAPTRFFIWSNFFFFHIKLIIVHEKLFHTYTHKKREQNDKVLLSKKRNNSEENDQWRAIVYRAPYKMWYPLRMHKGETRTQRTYDQL